MRARCGRPRATSGSNSERTLVAFDATSFGIQTGLHQPFHGPFEVHRGDGQPLAIHDVLVLEDEFTAGSEILVGTDHGIYTAWFDGDPASPGFGRLMRAEVPRTWPLEDGTWVEPDWPREAGTPWRRIPLNRSECAWGQFPFVEVVSWLGWMGEARSGGLGALLFRVEESDVWSDGRDLGPSAGDRPGAHPSSGAGLRAGSTPLAQLVRAASACEPWMVSPPRS